MNKNDVTLIFCDVCGPRNQYLLLAGVVGDGFDRQDFSLFVDGVRVEAERFPYIGTPPKTGDVFHIYAGGPGQFIHGATRVLFRPSRNAKYIFDSRADWWQGQPLVFARIRFNGHTRQPTLTVEEGL